MSDTLVLLSNIISTNIDSIQAVYAAHNGTFPSLDDPSPRSASSAATDPKVIQSINAIVAAAAQLIATVRAPEHTIIDASTGHHFSAAIGTATALNITEILREAGDKGLHADEIGKRAGSDGTKIGRVLRYLATRHIYREVSPDVFANNRISVVTDTGKSLKELLENPEKKHENTSGTAAVVGHLTDESAKATAYLPEFLSPSPSQPKNAPVPGSSQAPAATPFHVAVRTDLPLFEYFERPQEAHRLHRFGWAMKGTVNILLANSTGSDIIKGFPWSELPAKSVVIDVGGGVGSTTLRLARAYSHLRYIVQDRASVMGDAEKFWKNEFPAAISSGDVTLVPHDFFSAQPPLPAALADAGHASVFVMRFIMHDWADEYAHKILVHLRAAAAKDTKLVIIDNVIPYATPGDSPLLVEASAIPGATLPSPPAPLLANWGLASAPVFLADFQMMALLNSLERTVGQFVQLISGAGWKLDYIKRGGTGGQAVLVSSAV